MHTKKNLGDQSIRQANKWPVSLQRDPIRASALPTPRNKCKAEKVYPVGSSNRSHSTFKMHSCPQLEIEISQVNTPKPDVARAIVEGQGLRVQGSGTEGGSGRKALSLPWITALTFYADYTIIIPCYLTPGKLI